ncbi:MAG: I78 family peptidase inhibitor [Pseudomonadota bacterium]|nr:peptidase inhibitor I78 [Sphingomonas sp.]MDQ3479222.1 I78 family peptidase inhibitor [Pseudomonadota bacterium]
MTRFLHVAALAALLAACGSGPHPGARNPLILPPAYGTPSAPAQVAPAAAAPGAECNNAGLDRFAGQPATAASGSEMLRVSRARTIRWVRPGMMITMDFNPQRLTVYLARGNVIQRASCG